CPKRRQLRARPSCQATAGTRRRRFLESELLSLIEAAGWPIWFLIFTSIAALALIIERGLALRRSRVLPDGLLDELAGLRGAIPVTPDLLARLSASSPLGRVLAAGARHEPLGRARMKEAMEDTG